jgi:hypothetical protein
LTAASPAILLVDPVFLTKRFLSHSTGKKETPFQVRIKVPFVLSPIPICRCRRRAVPRRAAALPSVISLTRFIIRKIVHKSILLYSAFQVVPSYNS